MPSGLVGALKNPNIITSKIVVCEWECPFDHAQCRILEISNEKCLAGDLRDNKLYQNKLEQISAEKSKYVNSKVSAGRRTN